MDAQFDSEQGCVDNITLEQEIKKLTYKPRWEFTFQPNPNMLIINMCVQDARNYGEWCDFTVKRLIPDYAQDTTGMFTEWVKGVLADVEMHELREFLRYDGELVDTPHE